MHDSIDIIKLLGAKFNDSKGIAAAGRKVGISGPCVRKYIRRQVEEIIGGY